MPTYVGSANARQVFIGKDGGFDEAQEIFVEREGGLVRVHRAPTPLRVESFSASPTFWNQGTSGAPANVTFSYALSSLPTSLSVTTSRPDGTTSSSSTPAALSGTFTLGRPTILGRTTYVLNATDSRGVAHASATFESRLAAAITSFTDGGFRTDPGPGGSLVYKHRLDWVLSPAVYPGLSDPRYSATLAKVSGPGSVQSDALRATNKSDGRGTLNVTSGQANRGQVTVVRLTATNTAGSVNRTVRLTW